jgi:predicted unusual protein kinase regulating ubiquinone biosynthesis (AarF/ABC1/UbiB family)
MVMELAMSDISQIIRRLKPNLTDRNLIKKTIMKQQIDALFHLFRSRISHNDAHNGNFFYMKGGRIVLGDFGLAKNIYNRYEFPDCRFVNAYVVTLPKQDADLMRKILRASSRKPNKSEQRKLRDAFIQLWANSQKWDCLSDAELAAKVEPLLDN